MELPEVVINGPDSDEDRRFNVNVDDTQEATAPSGKDDGKLHPNSAKRRNRCANRNLRQRVSWEPQLNPIKQGVNTVGSSCADKAGELCVNSAKQCRPTAKECVSTAEKCATTKCDAATQRVSTASAAKCDATQSLSHGTASATECDTGTQRMSSTTAATCDRGTQRVDNTTAAKSDTGTQHVSNTAAAKCDTGTQRVSNTAAAKCDTGTQRASTANAQNVNSAIACNHTAKQGLDDSSTATTTGLVRDVASAASLDSSEEDSDSMYGYRFRRHTLSGSSYDAKSLGKRLLHLNHVRQLLKENGCPNDESEGPSRQKRHSEDLSASLPSKTLQKLRDRLSQTLTSRRSSADSDGSGRSFLQRRHSFAVHVPKKITAPLRRNSAIKRKQKAAEENDAALNAMLMRMPDRKSPSPTSSMRSYCSRSERSNSSRSMTSQNSSSLGDREEALLKLHRQTTLLQWMQQEEEER
ncbi:hypothetical protein BaRGS_00029660 [Batillaria attramentaria]|uniref:Uncharacterized protein n=1 Tax=Batillaria attramentaria TaxID=370345 RepID=A0ABD0JX36_9CAEN